MPTRVVTPPSMINDQLLGIKGKSWMHLRDEMRSKAMSLAIKEFGRPGTGEATEKHYGYTMDFSTVYIGDFGLEDEILFAK
uniref:Cytochrome P450 n=1 Tax=Steinernema glaseri TaxID=37863 RepID=A0A1I8ASP1_9BILA